MGAAARVTASLRSSKPTMSTTRPFRTVRTRRQWLLRQRVLLSQQLLETSDVSVDVIATRRDLGSAANLVLQFQRHVRISPSAYRRPFRQAAVT